MKNELACRSRESDRGAKAVLLLDREEKKKKTTPRATLAGRNKPEERVGDGGERNSFDRTW